MISKRGAIFLFGFTCFAAAVVLAVYMYIAPKFKYSPPNTKVATAFRMQKKLNHFLLYDTDGNIFTNKSLRGHWTLLFFGYTKCPDICPRTLGIIRESWNMFAASNQAAPVKFVFADISPVTVNGAELKKYVHNYDSNFLGIYGSSEQMRNLSDQLGIFAEQKDEKIDHTASLMLIDPQGNLSAIFTPPFTAADIVHDLTVLTL